MNMKIRALIGLLSFVKPKYTVYFDNLGIECTPKEINKFIRSKELGSAVGNNEYKHRIQLCADNFL